MRNRLAALALGALGSLAFACSSTPINPYAEVSEYCTAYAQAICQIENTSCCAEPQMCSSDVSTCETYQTSTCNQTAATATASGTLQYNSGNVKPCIDAVNAAYSGSPATISEAVLANISQLCASVFVGSVPTGGACTIDQDCATSGQICASAPGQTAKCSTATPRSQGNECLDTGDQCQDSYCDSVQGSSSYGTCVPPQTFGQPCSATELCDGADYCDSTTGTCQALAGNGAPCTISANCAAGLFCDTFVNGGAPTPGCVGEYTFVGRGAVDCQGLLGTANYDAGSGSSSGGSGSGSGSGSGGNDAGGD